MNPFDWIEKIIAERTSGKWTYLTNGQIVSPAPKFGTHVVASLDPYRVKDVRYIAAMSVLDRKMLDVCKAALDVRPAIGCLICNPDVGFICKPCYFAQKVQEALAALEEARKKVEK